MTRFSFFASLISLFFFNLNCGGNGITKTDVSQPCGPGTIEVDGQCLPKDELCDGVDNDGDDLTDEGCPNWDDINIHITTPVEECDEVDNDGDGVTDEGCDVPDYDEDNDGFSPFDGDCNDNDFRINPAATEKCDDQDNDCDGVTDEDDPIMGDWCVSTTVINGNPVAVQGTEKCHGIAGMICTPLPIEQCQQNEEDCETALDDNCNGHVNEGCGGIHTIDWCNNQDDDADGETDEDDPNMGALCYTLRVIEGVGVPVLGRYECVNGNIYCTALPLEECQANNEACGNGFDDNCNGFVDEGCGDDPVEWCNGIDDDGDGSIDEDDPNIGHFCTTILHVNDNDVPVQGTYVCGEGGIVCAPPSLEECQLQAEDCENGLDDNCDGQVNEGCEEALPPHYCEPHYSNHGTFLGFNGCCGTGFPTATHVDPGMLIKATEYNAVYYYASDGNRYVFPTSIELDSWYSPLDVEEIPISPNDELCQQVYEIPVELLASIPLGGNVTRRPGAFITGIEGSSIRYVVSRCGTLREVFPVVLLDEIYTSIYGSTAWPRTKLIKDAFWMHYILLDEPVTSVEDFDWHVEYNTAGIEEELGISGICSDQDGDGYSPFLGDCDDNDPDLHPDAQELCDDGVDNNCDGQIDEDCGECAVDADCDDGDPCTEDTCTSNECGYSDILYCEPCDTDEDCVARDACMPYMDDYHAVSFDGTCMSGYCLRSFVGTATCQNGAPHNEDPSCVEDPFITFAADTPSGFIVPGVHTQVAKIQVTAGTDDRLFHSLVINAYASISSPDGDDELWQIEDDLGFTIGEATVNLGQNSLEVVFNFDTPQDIFAGQTKYFHLSTETTEMTTAGDALQMWLNTICGMEQWGMTIIKP